MKKFGNLCPKLIRTGHFPGTCPWSLVGHCPYQTEDKNTCGMAAELILSLSRGVRTEWHTDPGATGVHLVISGNRP